MSSFHHVMKMNHGNPIYGSDTVVLYQFIIENFFSLSYQCILMNVLSSLNVVFFFNRLVIVIKEYLVIAVVVNVSIVPEVQAGQDGIHLRPPDAFGHQLVVAIRLPFPHHLPPGNTVVTIQEENSLSAPARKVET
jgi:hypothetical protein